MANKKEKTKHFICIKKEENERRTSGRGARLSYRTTLDIRHQAVRERNVGP